MLQLAPGGHLGRFIIWTKSAFDQLDSIFGKLTPKACCMSHHILVLLIRISSVCWVLISSWMQPRFVCLLIIHVAMIVQDSSCVHQSLHIQYLVLDVPPQDVFD